MRWDRNLNCLQIKTILDTHRHCEHDLTWICCASTILGFIFTSLLWPWINVVTVIHNLNSISFHHFHQLSLFFHTPFQMAPQHNYPPLPIHKGVICLGQTSKNLSRKTLTCLFFFQTSPGANAPSLKWAPNHTSSVLLGGGWATARFCLNSI